MGRLVEQADVVADADERTAIAWQRDHRQDAEHCVHGAPLEAELAEIATGEERFRVTDARRCGWTSSHAALPFGAIAVKTVNAWLPAPTT
jgi:hypothetical protein